MSRFSCRLESAADLPLFKSHLETLRDKRIAPRILSQDDTVLEEFAHHRELPAASLRWASSFHTSITTVQRIWTSRARKRIRLIGMGGASQSAKAYSIFADQAAAKDFAVLDSTAAQFLEPFVDAAGAPLNHAETGELYIVASKSGETVETLDIGETLRLAVEQSGRPADFLVITDPGDSTLAHWAHEHAIQIIRSEPAVAGRYTALSVLGLVPAHLLGLRLETVRKACQHFLAQIHDDQSETAGWTVSIAAATAVAAVISGSRMRLRASSRMRPVLQWLEQLVAESLGKSGLGVLPVIEMGRDETDNVDVVCIECTVPSSPAASAADRASMNAVRLSRFQFETKIQDLSALVHFFFAMETAVFMAGCLAQINPLDQPDVEASKANTRSLLQVENADAAWHDAGPQIHFCDETAPEKVVCELRRAAASKNVSAHRYIAILAYLNPCVEVAAALESLALRIEAATGLSAVMNFGPQYLHSTGQFHKGGAGAGVFLMIRGEPASALAAANRDYGFEDLLKQQAAGDAAALQALGRAVITVCLSQNTVENLHSLVDAFAVFEV